MRATPPKKERPTKLVESQNLFPVVGVGASAGGLDAFKKLLKAIPKDSGMAYVLVQHLDPNHQSLLPEILQKVTSIPVLEITDDIKVQPNHIYVIPSNKMMVATDGILVLTPRPEKNKNERNLPIDLFFASLAEVHQTHAIGVVLSGTATDGTLGLKAIKDHGGITFAQEESSAEYEGMPDSAVNAGVVDFILPPEEIPQKLLDITSRIVVSDEELENLPQQDESVFKQILSLLRIRKGVDFTHYKQTTVRRRILRRMVVNKNEEPGEYLKFLRGNNPEQDLLYQDMLIPVTSFFRDKKVFENLCKHVFPAILKNKVPGEVTRIWVAGCSTGQEVYSFAMCFKEFLGEVNERIQIFGTDLSEPAIAKARSGIYEKTELDGLSAQRLQEFFTKTNGNYQINKSIRDMCVFAHHNFLKDPPFGKMDCISCRNVLIYMEPYLQKKALTTFHYALDPKGFLLLGKSETTAGMPDLFGSLGKTDKLFTRKDVPGRFIQVTSHRSEQILGRANNHSKIEAIRTDFQKTADDILLTRYTPAGVVVNEAMDIVHFRGNTGNYLEQAPGKPSHNLMMMAKYGLAFELRNILHKAKTEKKSVVKENIPLQVNGSLRNISIEAIELPNTLEPYFLILFHDNNINVADGSAISSKRKTSTKTKKDEKDVRIQLLEQELAQAREDMRSITENQEAVNEELQSANEELLSGSEELQSLNEELETSKEELQSTNEELTVLNNELLSLNEQVTDARNYSESIVATLYQPLLVLDKHLRVKTANKSFYETFKVNELETEGLLVYDLGNRQWNIPELRILLEEVLPQKTKVTDFEVTHKFTSIGERKILLNALEIKRERKEEKLILLSIEDVTEQRLSQRKEKKFLSRFHDMLLQTPVPIAIFRGSNYIVELVNDSGLELLVKDKSFIAKPLFEVMPELEDPIKEIFDKIMETGIPFNANEMEVTLFRNGRNETGWFNINYQPIREDDNTISGILTSANEVTDQVVARKKIADSEKRYNLMLMNSPFAFAVLKGKNMVITLANDSLKEVWGKGKDLEGKPLLEVLPEIKDSEFPKLLDNVYTTGTPFSGQELLAKVFRNGKLEDVYFNFVYQPYLEADETISGVTVIAYEVTAQVIAKKKIEESEKRFRNLVEKAPYPICIFKGRELKMEVANELMLQIFNVGEDVLGMPFLEILPEMKEQPFIALLLDVLENGTTHNGSEQPAYFVRKNGEKETYYFNFVYQPYRENDGAVSGVMVLATNVTEQVMARKKIEESEEHFRQLADLLPAKISNADAAGTVTYFNKHWLDFVGLSFEELRDFGYHKIMHPDELEEFNRRLQKAAQAGTVLEMEMRFMNKQGEYIWHLNLASPIKDTHGHIKMWVGSTTDIHQQKEHEAVLEKAVKRRTHELEIMNKELEDANTELTTFNYVSSHDLQEPLRKIQNFAGIILAEEEKSLSDTGKVYFQKIIRTTNRMQTLIEDLLAYSRVKNDERIPEILDLNVLLGEVLIDFEEIIKQKRAVIEVNDLCELKVIAFQFRQVLQNLIGNSLKFSKATIPPHIIIKSVILTGQELNNETLDSKDRFIPKKKYCHITFSDNGIGFDAQYSDRIFQVFQRLHSFDAYAGTGIGLAICKRIIENNRGIITATGKINEGAQFDIYLPVD